MNKRKFILGILLISWPLSVQAGILDNLSCVSTGACGLSDVESGFQLLTNWLLGGIGALGLLYFIWGAGQWITSYGQPNKIEKGREIMMGSVIAIVIALISFILVQFFVNDVLLGGQNSDFRVSSECVGANQGKICNAPLRNYVCSGQFTEPAKQNASNLCITECELKSLIGEDKWICVDRKFAEELEEAFEGASTEDGCPSEEQVCLNLSSVPENVLNSGANGANAGEDYPGCCQLGFQNCEPSSAEDCRAQSGQFFSRSCGQVNFCNSGYVQQSHGCCVSESSPISCQDVSQGDVCEENGNTLIPYQNCSELDYCN